MPAVEFKPPEGFGIGIFFFSEASYLLFSGINLWHAKTVVRDNIEFVVRNT